MPRSGSGSYSLPTGNPVVTGTTIETSWANNTLSDIATALTDSLSRSGQGGMTAALRVADGTSGLPGLAWTNETTSGFYRAGSADLRLAVTTNQVQQWLTTGSAITGTFSASGNVSFDGGSFTFNEAGADKDARFEGDSDPNLLVTDASTDRVGVGTNTPASKLHVAGSIRSTGTDGAAAATTAVVDYVAGTTARIVSYGPNASTPGAIQFSGLSSDASAGDIRATITSAGDVGIGTTSPTQKLDVRGNIYLNNVNGYVYVDNGGAGGASLKMGVTGTSDAYVYAVESDPLLLGTGNTERFRIGTAGELGIGGANYGTSGQVLASQGSGAAPQWVNAATGDVTLTGTQTLTNKTLTDPILTLGTDQGTAGQVPVSQGAGLPPAWQTLTGGFSNIEVITASQTWTIPAGVTKAKFTVVGGGGDGSNGAASNAGGGGGGGGGGAIKVLSGLTPGNTLTITVGASGGTSSIASGTQSITTISATGGAGAGANAGGGSGGIGSGGNINFSGGGGSTGGSYIGGAGGCSLFGGGAPSPVPNGTSAAAGVNGGNYGGGGSGSTRTGANGGTGAQGVVVIEY